jgi:predicted metal-binding membrane protein
MRRISRRLEPWLLVLIAASLGAWAMLALGGGDFDPVVLCSAGGAWASLSVSLDLALLFESPSGLAADWALMIVAMMSPLVAAPLRHMRDRSFARRRTRAAFLFLVGYAAVWMSAGLALLAIALAARAVAPAPSCLALATVGAIAWQVSPAKQWCLNRCHRRPHLSAFGAPADRDAFVFGLINGVACAGACWALMLLPLFAGPAHLAAMVAVTLFVYAERLEPAAPLAWRWRGAGKALRIIAVQTTMRLAPRTREIVS